MTWLHLVASVLGLSATAAYSLVWWRVFRGGGAAYFSAGWERTVEPFLLALFIGVQAASVVIQLRSLRKGSRE